MVILGESKSKIYRREARRFAREVEKVESKLAKRAIKVMFGFYIHPSAHEPAKEHNIHLVAS